MRTVTIPGLPIREVKRPSWIRAIANFLSHDIKRRSMIRSFEQLDDHLLADLGLQRHSIEHAVDRYLVTSDP